MKLKYLKPAPDYRVIEWLEKSELNLTVYQKECLRKSEMIRFSRFRFYEPRKEEKVNFLWRFTIIVIPIYYLLLFIFLPLNYLATGTWGFGQKFYDNFHAVWMNKLKM